MAIKLEIKLEELRKRKLFLATPCYGGNCTGMFARSVADLSALCAQYGIPLQMYFLFNESLITRARAYSADEFMRSDCTHMMFVDSDIGFNANDVIALLAMVSDESPYDVIGAPYPKKTIAFEKIVQAVHKGLADKNPNDLEKYVGDYVFNPKTNSTSIPLGEPVEVLEIGTGFMMIRKNTFNKFKEHYKYLSYKPDHVRTEHFDGTREIMMYFDTPIDRGYWFQEIHDIMEKLSKGEKVDNVEEKLKELYEKEKKSSKRYLSEDYSFCLPSQSKVLTEHGLMSISKIVNTKYNGKVKSLNSNGIFEWNNIIGWSKKKNSKYNKKWVRIKTYSDNNTRSKLYCTDDHRVAYCDNVFAPEINYIEAKELHGKYIINYSETNRKYHKHNTLYNKNQISALIGTLLGDASVSKAGQISITHSIKQQDYIEHKSKLFDGVLNSKIRNAGFGTDHFCSKLHLPINSQTKELRSLFYNNSIKKNISSIIHMLDDIGLAYLYMDDGTLNNNRYMNIHTNGYSYSEHELIISHFNRKWNVNGKIYKKYLKYKDSIREYYYLAFSKDDSDKLFEIISPYIIESMRYKLPETYRSNKLIELNLNKLEYSASKVKDIEYVPHYRSNLYDIEVENTHNFITNNTLVHNCRMVQDIGMKVWLCPWMKLVHVGTYIFGGSLMDLAQLGASATADVEVLNKYKSKK